MGLNGISSLSTKQQRQEAKLNIAEAKRQGRTVASNGAISGSVDSTKPYYRARNQLDMTTLATVYVGNTVVSNPHPSGLQIGRPWETAAQFYNANLYRYTYTGYHGDDPNWFAGQTASSSTTDNTLSVGAIPEYTSYQWVGYFRPNTTETYTFYITTDDGSYLWVGGNAESDFAVVNATVNNGGLKAATEVSATVSLTAGLYYPFRIQAGNNSGPGSHSTAFSTPTISKTTTFAGLVFHNQDTLGI